MLSFDIITFWLFGAFLRFVGFLEEKQTWINATIHELVETNKQ